MFADEAGLYQLPAAVRTWAPRREPPVYSSRQGDTGASSPAQLRTTFRPPGAPRRHQRRRTGRQALHARQRATHARQRAADRREGSCIVSPPRSPGGLRKASNSLADFRLTGKTADGFLREGASRRFHLEQLPGYAPDLNPDEVEPG